MGVLQKLVFTGGMNSDSAPEDFQPGEARLRVNCRVLSSDNGNEGALEIPLGNTLVSYSLPSGGTYKVIGAKEDLKRGKGYYFVYSSAGHHLILQYNMALNTITKVLQEAATAPFYLNFNEDFPITGINIVELDADNHLLYWTDNYTAPKKINIEKAVYYSAGNFTLGYKSPLEESIVYRIKNPPQCAPTPVWSNTIVQETTFVADQTTSAPQTVLFATGISVVTIDNDITDPDNVFNTGTNTFTVGVTGYYSVSATLFLSGIAGSSARIELFVNGVSVASEVYAVGIVEAGCFIQVPNMLFTVGDTVQIMLTPLVHDIVISTTAASIFGASYYGTSSTGQVNFLFKKLFRFKVQFVYDDKEVSAWSPISRYELPVTTLSTLPNSGEDFDTQDNLLTVTVPTGSTIVTKIRISAQQLGTSNFALIAELDKAELGISDNSTYAFEFFNDGNYFPLEVNESNKLFDSVPLKSASQDIIAGNRMVDGLVTQGFDPVEVDMKLPLSFVQVTTNTNEFFPARSYLKSGGIYKYGIVYYFRGNQSGLTNIAKGKSTELISATTNRYGTTLFIPFLTDPNYDAPRAIPNLGMKYVPEVGVEIYNRPPADATHYQIVRSKNEAIETYIQFTNQRAEYLILNSAGNYVANPANTAELLRITIVNISDRYKAENPNSTLGYSFVKGDRIRFIADADQFVPAYTFIDPFYDYNDSEIISGDSSAGTIMIKMSSSTPQTLPLTGATLLEIYRPAKNVIDDNEIMYEIGECYEIGEDVHGNPIHEGTTGDQLITPFTTATYASPPTLDITALPTGHGLTVNDLVKVITTGYSVYGIVTASAANTATIDTTGYTLMGTFNGALAGTITKAATFTLSSGDSFRRKCDMPWIIAGPTIYRLYSFIETEDASNMFASNAADYGRPNRIDANERRIIRPSTVLYSEAFIPETNINGLSSVYDTNFEAYEHKYGGIYKLYSEDQRLIIFQELKVGQILVEQIIFNSMSLQMTVGASPVILNTQIVYYAGEYGIGQNPESFAVFGKVKYFIDLLRGTALRLSQDGLTPISDVAKMHNYFTDHCAEIRAIGATHVRIYGAYDTKFYEYIIAFEEIKRNPTYPGATIAFNEKYNVFSTFYTWKPDFMLAMNNGLITFKDGALYTHNTNTTYNNYYGVQSLTGVQSMMNIDPSKKKVLQAISLETDEAWDLVTITTPQGQSTHLITANFEDHEDYQYSEIKMDENTPVVLNPIVEGNPMRSQTALIDLRWTKTTYNKLYAVNIMVIPSQRSNS